MPGVAIGGRHLKLHTQEQVEPVRVASGSKVTSRMISAAIEQSPLFIRLGHIGLRTTLGLLADHGHIELQPTDGAAQRVLPATPPGASELAWSPDSQRLAFIAEGDVWTLSLHEATPTRLTHDPAGPGDPRGASDHHPQWNPKYPWILYQLGRKGSKELYVVSTDGTRQHLLAPTKIHTGDDVILPTTPDHGDAVSSDRFNPVPAWSPDGTRLAFTERSRQFFSGKLEVLPFNPDSGIPSGPATNIYIAKNDPGGAWAVETGYWSPDSRTLAVVLQQSGWDKFWLIPAAGGPPVPLTTGTGENEDPVYSPDGKWIAFTSNRDLAEEQHLRYTNRNSKIRWETKMGGTPSQKPTVYRQANILPDVARITTPILLMHGEEHPQVPPQESIEFAAALKQNKRHSCIRLTLMRAMASSSVITVGMRTNASSRSSINTC